MLKGQCSNSLLRFIQSLNWNPQSMTANELGKLQTSPCLISKWSSNLQSHFHLCLLQTSFPGLVLLPVISFLQQIACGSGISKILILQGNFSDIAPSTHELLGSSNGLASLLQLCTLWHSKLRLIFSTLAAALSDHHMVLASPIHWDLQLQLGFSNNISQALFIVPNIITSVQSYQLQWRLPLH